MIIIIIPLVQPLLYKRNSNIQRTEEKQKLQIINISQMYIPQ